MDTIGSEQSASDKGTDQKLHLETLPWERKSGGFVSKPNKFVESEI